MGYKHPEHIIFSKTYLSYEYGEHKMENICIWYSVHCIDVSHKGSVAIAFKHADLRLCLDNCLGCRIRQIRNKGGAKRYSQPFFIGMFNGNNSYGKGNFFAFMVKNISGVGKTAENPEKGRGEKR